MDNKILIDEDAVREALGGLRYSRDSAINDEDYQRFNGLCRNLEHALRKAELTPTPTNKITLPAGRKITPLGKYIREIRLKNDITLLEMADALGMNPSELCGIETGDLEKPRFFAAAVAQYFSGALIHFDCAKLFELDDVKFPSETEAKHETLD